MVKVTSELPVRIHVAQKLQHGADVIRCRCYEQALVDDARENQSGDVDESRVLYVCKILCGLVSRKD